ncbi:thiamine diphosphokinase [Peptoniphilus sp.]|uniref:thiamine diphosphokinase n=1 Tax=Peptoniphilus sp. TaxID=1971214 RepID=UPI003991CDD4
MKGLIVSGGNRVRRETLFENIEDRFIVVADGGIKNLVGTDIIPDEVLGDFDSIDEEGKSFIEKNNIKIEKYPSRKDFTDTELCLEVLLKKGADDIIILGATGTRLDHMFSSMFLLERLKKESVAGKFIDDYNEVSFISNETVEVKKNKYKYLSIVPVSKEVCLTLNGTEYEVENLKFNRFTTIAVSNEVKDEVAKIEIDGEGFLILSRD